MAKSDSKTVNPEKSSQASDKKVDEGKRISDAEGNVYGDFGGK